MIYAGIMGYVIMDGRLHIFFHLVYIHSCAYTDTDTQHHIYRQGWRREKKYIYIYLVMFLVTCTHKLKIK